MELNAMAWSTTETSEERMELNAMARSTTEIVHWRKYSGGGLNSLGHRLGLKHSDIVSEQFVKTWWQPGEDLVAA
jgi:hypothetical protein